jgi:hypothetical protein
MDQISGFVSQNGSWLGPVILGLVLIGVVYMIYTYLYAGQDPTYTLLLDGEAVARAPVTLTNPKLPRISTGTDFTYSMWFYVDDYNYRAAQSKYLFTIGPELLGTNANYVLVSLLGASTNDLIIRANSQMPTAVAAQAPGSIPAATGSATPDITNAATLSNMLNQQTSMAMFQSTVGSLSTDPLTPCDIRDVPLQKWVNLTIVVSGRTMDVYLDGKLSRSCVLDNVVTVPSSRLVLRMGESGGFGGRVSYVQMWGSQLTPDAIYGIYQMGPARVKTNLFQRLAKFLDLDVTFTGPTPGQPAPAAVSQMSGDPFGSLYQSSQSMYSSAGSDLSSAEQYAKGMYARL